MRRRVAALSQHLRQPAGLHNDEGRAGPPPTQLPTMCTFGQESPAREVDSHEPYRFCPPYDEHAMVAFYNVHGFVLVSGLIPPSDVEAAVGAMWRTLAESDDADRKPVVREDRSTWPRGVVAPQLFDKKINALWNSEYLRIGEVLSDGYEILEGTPGRDLAPLRPPMGPRGLMAINSFPVAPEGGEEATAAAGAWEMPGSHLDHCIPEDGFLTFPRPVRMSTMTYLTECAGGDAEAHGGSTVVWPGSSRKFEKLAATDPARFQMMIDLGNAREEARVGVAGAEQPIEIKHRAGDVLFYDIFCSHSGSSNTSMTPRLAFNVKWGTGKRISERKEDPGE